MWAKQSEQFFGEYVTEQAHLSKPVSSTANVIVAYVNKIFGEERKKTSEIGKELKNLVGE